MKTITIFNIAAEMWGVAICLFALAALLFEKNQKKNMKYARLLMEILCVLLLAADMCSLYFDGGSGTLAYYMVRVSNFMVYFVNYIYMSVFIIHLWFRLEKHGEKKPARMKLVWAFSAFGISLLIASIFSDDFVFYIDAANVYHRSSMYLVAQSFGFVGLAVCATMLIQYRKRLENAVYWACMTYFVLPMLATVIMMFQYGISFQNLAIVGSTQIMFMVDILEIGRKLDTTMLAYERVSHEAELDAMTGLYNKISGTKRIHDFISSMTENDSASLSFVDIDNFKQINDTYGHAAGDYWIEYVAKLLRDECGTDEVACRFGGDEYVLLLRGDDTKTLAEKMRRFAKKMKRKATERGQEVHCSAGVCLLRGGGYDAEKCIRQADNALYDAKRHGKDTSVIYRVHVAGIEKLSTQ